MISEHAAGDPDRWWYANRFVFARLMLDERKTKARIKQQLLDANRPCHLCDRPFDSRKNIHLHRLDGSKGYNDGNCVLMHGECHQRLHVGHPAAEESARQWDPVVTRRSKCYSDQTFLYWWDISPGLAASLEHLEAVEFVKADTGEYCSVPTSTLTKFMTPERQSKRGNGNWGVKVLSDHPDELALEPGTGGGEWAFLPVVWLSQEAED
jgi:hypothetical protein